MNAFFAFSELSMRLLMVSANRILSNCSPSLRLSELSLNLGFEESLIEILFFGWGNRFLNNRLPTLRVSYEQA